MPTSQWNSLDQYIHKCKSFPHIRRLSFSVVVITSILYSTGRMVRRALSEKIEEGLWRPPPSLTQSRVGLEIWVFNRVDAPPVQNSREGE